MAIAASANITFVAPAATPKGKTLRLFGTQVGDRWPSARGRARKLWAWFGPEIDQVYGSMEAGIAAAKSLVHSRFGGPCWCREVTVIGFGPLAGSWWSLAGRLFIPAVLWVRRWSSGRHDPRGAALNLLAHHVCSLDANEFGLHDDGATLDPEAEGAPVGTAPRAREENLDDARRSPGLPGLRVAARPRVHARVVFPGTRGLPWHARAAPGRARAQDLLRRNNPDVAGHLIGRPRRPGLIGASSSGSQAQVPLTTSPSLRVRSSAVPPCSPLSAVSR
ncbi:hypothetical protein [Aeromicrobium piscarium]|uniref:hypothetical protein n=1 Tax=Aeromicrobium piscarium TaxID=2590901 RepID=UPI00163D9B6F|nr:hypothetical protein [Aeromicrobium piscarium]